MTLNDAAQEQNRLARQINLLGGVTTMVLAVATTAILWLKNRQLYIREASLSQSNQRLAASQKASQDLFYLTAHELKNALQNLMLSSSMTLQRAKGTGASKAAERVCRHVEKMSVLIQAILLEAAIASESFTLDLGELDLAQLIAEIVTDYQELAQIKEQQLDFTADTPCPITADGGKIHIAIENLISNAIKFSPLQSTITIRLKRFPDHVVVEVIDPGQGFTTEEKGRLFSRFPKLAARPTGGELSTGLGLSLTQALVASHGGTVDAESPGKGCGSRFWIQLPRVPNPGRSPETT
ncbi:MAG: HAMP domain-containing histidine kinase [Oscillatoriales cyanobacterium SM2_2_1]|nr:HAMP domain-containing histidine kinase [Oscillatoriales cyanobacterium SM2_2_1]